MAPLFHRNVCLGLIAFLLMCSLALGQTAATGGLTGTITDPTGAIVPGATVVVTNAGTGLTRTVTTGADGSYKALLLPPGTYNVKVDAASFKTTEVKNITVVVTEAPVVNVKLELGVKSEQVQVEANAEAVQTTNSTVGTVVTGNTMTEIPLATRNFTNMLSLSAGANADVTNAAALGKGTQQIQVNGGSYLNNTYAMDGAVVNNFASNQSTEGGSNAAFGIPNPDAIQEFKVQTSNYDASYGRNSGANVNVVTKSGTNQFHGTAFEFFRNTALNANEWFNKNTEIRLGQPNKQQVLNQNQFGGSFGGPVKKDKLFFFISYQQTNQKNGATGYGSSQGVNLPSLPAGDRSTAAFKSALGAIYCHQPTYTQIVGLGGVQVACDGSNINPAALNILNLKLANGSYYVPGAPTGGGPVSFSDPAIYKEYQGIGNFDYVVTPKNTLSGRYFFATDPTSAPFPGSGLGFPAPNVPGNPVFLEYGNQSASLKLTSVLTPTFLNELRFSYQRTTVTNRNEIPFTSSQAGMQPLQSTVPYLANIWFLPIFSATSFDIGAHPFFTQNEAMNQFQLAESISWTHGRHTIRAGFDLERDQWNWIMPSLSTGVMIFGSFPDFLVGLGACPNNSYVPPGIPVPGACNINNPVGSNGTPVSNILSEPNFSVRQEGYGVYHPYRGSSYDWFVQDNIKVNSRLTLNVGLRWDYFPALTDAKGLMTNLSPELIAAAGKPGSSPATGSFAGYIVPANYTGPAVPKGVLTSPNNTIVNAQSKTNFAPRLGFSWLPFNGVENLVLRGGGGFFYDRIPASSYIWATQVNIPYAFTIPFDATASLGQPFNQTPLGWNASRWIDFSTANSPGGVASSNLSTPLLPQSLTTPLVYTWNLQMQYAFNNTWTLELGYVGTRGIHGLNFNEDYINLAPLASAAHPINGITTNTSGNAPLRAPYLGMTPQVTATTNRGDTHYNGLQATIRKQLSHGLSLQANYTWSKTVGTAGTDRDHQEAIDFNTGNLLYQELYRPQRFSIMYSYDFPYKDQPGFKGKLLGGWNLSGTTVVQSGSAMGIYDSSGGTVYFGSGGGSLNMARPNYCANQGPANIAAGGSMYARVTSGLAGGSGFFNKGVFCGVPSLGPGDTLSGNAGVGLVRGPGQNNWDVAFQKTTRVGGVRESASLLFRAEFFNAWNTPQFKNPNVDANSPSYGQIVGTAVNPRVLQFALKYVF
jgi:hypothetical protein